MNGRIVPPRIAKSTIASQGNPLPCGQLYGQKDVGFTMNKECILQLGELLSFQTSGLIHCFPFCIKRTPLTAAL